MKARFKVGDIVGISTNYTHFPANGKTGKIKSILEFPNGDICYCIKTFDSPFNVCIRECEAVPAMTSEEVIASAYPHRAYVDTDSVRNYVNEDIRRTQEMMDTVGKMIHEKEERKMSMTPKKIMRNGPATIVFWEDGTKTVVKKMSGDKDDIYAAFCAAFTKKHFGSNEKVKAVVDSLTQPSEEDIERATEKFLQKHYRAFCNGYRVAVSKSDFKCDEHAFEKILKSINAKGFITKKNFVCYDGRWLVTRDDTKYIEWNLKNKYFNGEIVVTLGYTNGDPYRMEKIADNLVKDGYAIACSYRTNYTNPISTYIDEIKVYKK